MQRALLNSTFYSCDSKTQSSNDNLGKLGSTSLLVHFFSGTLETPMLIWPSWLSNSLSPSTFSIISICGALSRSLTEALSLAFLFQGRYPIVFCKEAMHIHVHESYGWWASRAQTLHLFFNRDRATPRHVWCMECWMFLRSSHPAPFLWKFLDFHKRSICSYLLQVIFPWKFLWASLGCGCSPWTKAWAAFSSIFTNIWHSAELNLDSVTWCLPQREGLVAWVQLLSLH